MKALLPLLLLPCALARVPIIIDTDMDFDVGDLGAVCMANILQDLGEVSLLAVVHNTGYPAAIGAVSVINHYYGRDSVLLGAFKGDFGVNTTHGGYIEDLIETFPSPIQDSTQVEDAVAVFRQALASAQDGTVTIVSLGFLTNLASLLSSPGDSLSHLTGQQLVAQKVRHVAVMGGYYPDSQQGEDGSEFNFDCGKNYMGAPLECYGTARAAIMALPSSVRVTYLGFKAGESVWSGGAQTHCQGEESPCRYAYIQALGKGADVQSWDPMTLLMAVRGSSEGGCREEGRGGSNWVGEGGENMWEEGVASNQSYMVLESPAWMVKETIDSILCTARPQQGGVV